MNNGILILIFFFWCFVLLCLPFDIVCASGLCPFVAIKQITLSQTEKWK